jgi:hypothetical protein
MAMTVNGVGVTKQDGRAHVRKFLGPNIGNSAYICGVLRKGNLGPSAWVNRGGEANVDAQVSTVRRDKPSSMAEVIAITIACVVGLGGFGAGLVTQDTTSALEGLALFFATYFYTLIRAYQLRVVDDDGIRTHRRAAGTPPAVDFWSWVDSLPKTLFHR